MNKNETRIADLIKEHLLKHGFTVPPGKYGRFVDEWTVRAVDVYQGGTDNWSVAVDATVTRKKFGKKKLNVTVTTRGEDALYDTSVGRLAKDLIAQL